MTCSCNRPWEWIPLEEIERRRVNRLADVETCRAEILEESGSDPGLVDDLEAELRAASEELAELEHELWHRQDDVAELQAHG